MKKTILAGAVMLAVGTVASAATMIEKDTTWSGTYGVGEYQVSGDVSLKNDTTSPFFQGGKEGNTSITFGEGAKLTLETTHEKNHLLISGSAGPVNVNLGDSGRLEMISNSSTRTQTAMVGNNVTITGGNNSYLSLKTTGSDIALGDNHNAGTLSINVNTLRVEAVSGMAIYRSNPGESLVINARDVEISGRVQQGGGGKTEIKGFDSLLIDGSSPYTVRAVEGSLKFQGNSGSVVTLKNSSGSLISSEHAESKMLIEAGTITLQGLTGVTSTSSGGNVTLKGDTINVEANTAISGKGDTFALSMSGTKEVNLKGNVTMQDSSTLSIDSPLTKVTGNITTANGAFSLDGELRFEGNKATIGNLRGDTATFTLTKADQEVSITNYNEALIVAATGDLNDEVGMDAFKNLTVGGKAEGVQVVAREGMYTGETTGVLNEKGEIVQTVTGANSIMSNVLDLASASTLSLNRILMNDVRKRMGDLRASEGTHGVWARYDGGKFSGSNGFENDFSTVQIGIDTAPAPDAPRFGVAFSYTTSDSDMQRGDAEMDAYSLAFYGTKFFENGMFVDVIGRLATIDTDVTIDGNKKGNLDNMAVSLSGEFGWRFDVNQSFYVEPQAEVTYTYLDSDKLKLSSGHEYELDSVDSLIGRLGFATGFKCPNNFGDVYLRASAVHEFLGDAAVHGGTYTLETDGDDTWVEFGVGANFNLNKNLYGYVDLERTEGADLDEDWRANVGVRYSF